MYDESDKLIELIRIRRLDRWEQVNDGLPLLDIRDVAELLSMTNGQVTQQWKKLGIPCVWIGKKPRFRRCDIAAWVKSLGKNPS